MSEAKCRVCDSDLNDRRDSHDRYVTHYDCPQCDKFDIAGPGSELTDRTYRSAAGSVTFDSAGADSEQDVFLALKCNPHLRKQIARYLYENRGSGGRTLLTAMKAEEGAHKEYQRVLTLDQAKDLYVTDLSPIQKYEQTLLNFANLSSRIGDQVNLVSNRYAVPTLDEEERRSICDTLAEEGLITTTNETVSLTLKGWARASELRRTTFAEPIVFIAAWFGEDTKEALNVIKAVVRELGYTPQVVNEVPHNDLIEMKIHELIERSRFVIADLTGNRQNVYYEIGLAHSEERQVVLTCRRDFFDSKYDDWKRVHFDLNHRLILVWDSEADLREKLRTHILQCFGRYGSPQATGQETS